MQAFISDWNDEIHIQTERLRALLLDISETQLNVKPSPSKWSAGEIVDHLIVSNKLYFRDFELLAIGKANRLKGLGYKFIPLLLGKMVVKFITPATTTKYKTVAPFQPAHVSHTMAIMDEFEHMQGELTIRVKELSGIDLDKTYIVSPASRFVIYTVRDALTILLNHEKRHIGQIETMLSK